MRYIDEFRSGELARALTSELAETMPPGRELALMEVCGGHTHAIYQHGLDELLPPGLELVHGPGCPVCVIPVGPHRRRRVAGARAERHLQRPSAT